jgi:hypothetical protein
MNYDDATGIRTLKHPTLWFSVCQTELRNFSAKQQYVYIDLSAQDLWRQAHSFA